MYGSIWQKGNKYYYFDDLGIYQLISNTIYEITDKETLAFLRDDYRSLRQLITNEKLIPVEGEKKVEIVVKYKSAVITMAKYSKIFLAIIVTVSIIIKIIRGLRK